MNFIALTFITSVIALVIYALFIYFAGSRRYCITSDAIQELLKPSYPVSERTLLCARARSNARLARTFRLANTFVSEDPQLHREFISISKSFLPQSLDQWYHLRDSARCAVKTTLSNAQSFHSLNMHHINFAEFLRITTFSLVADALLGADASSIRYPDALFVTEAISTLWGLSKTCSTPPAELLDEVNSHLNRWFPHLNHQDRLLDFVIPTYETMWRVVALAIARAVDSRDRVAFRAFLETPTSRQFSTFIDDGPSVEAYVNEVLRLHPPTRHISRTIQPSSPLFSAFIPAAILDWAHKAFTHTAVADIEGLHQNPLIWGDDAWRFDPMRFQDRRLTHEQKTCLLPFGYGALKCIAYNAAPKIAAIVAAAVMELFDEEGSGMGLMLVRGEVMGGREGWDGWAFEGKTAIDHSGKNDDILLSLL